MAIPTLAESKKIPEDQLWATVVSGKNPDGTDWSITLNTVTPNNPTYAEAIKIPEDDLLGIIVSGKTPNGNIWGVNITA